MKKMGNKRFLIAAVFIVLSAFLLTKESSATYICRSGPYYFGEFNPASWKPDKELNYEEVYRNYEYFEVFFSKSCDEITAKRYIKGQFDSSEKYKVNADGSLQKSDGRQ